MTKHIAFVLLVACQGGKKAAPRPEPAPAPKPAEPAPALDAAPRVPPPEAAAPVTTGLLAYGPDSKPVQCAGFTSSGAYLFTESLDNGLHVFTLQALGHADDPSLGWAQDEAHRGLDFSAEVSNVVAQMNAFVAERKLTPCARFAGTLAGKHAKVTVKGDTLTLTVGGETLTRTIDAGGDLAVDSMFTTPDANALVVGVQVFGEALSAYQGVYFGPDDLK